MANVDAARGLQVATSPYGSIKATLYPITVAYGTSLFRGDPIVVAAAGTAEIGTAGAAIMGSALGFFDVDMVPINYYVGSTATQAYVLVADDVNQEFIIQEDGDTSDLAATSVANNVNIIAGTGSSVTGESRYEIDSSSLNTTATLNLRLIRLERIQGNAYGDWAKWRVKINYHQAGFGTVGAGV
jgi:hypothetical protein